MTQTNAERQARHRDRQAHLATAGLAWETTAPAILGALDTLTRAVESLAAEVRALRNDGGKLARNGGQVTLDRYVTGADPLRNGEGAHARARETAPGTPTGSPGRADEKVTADAHQVLVTLTRPGSAGAIVDALSAVGRDMSLARVSAALVALQDRGQVRRIPGEGPDPDLWEAVEDDHLEDLAGPSRLRPPEPSPPIRVDCSDYRDHGTSHRWDPALGRFRCYACHPDPGPPTVSHGRGAAPPGGVHVAAS